MACRSVVRPRRCAVAARSHAAQDYDHGRRPARGHRHGRDARHRQGHRAGAGPRGLRRARRRPVEPVGSGPRRERRDGRVPAAARRRGADRRADRGAGRRAGRPRRGARLRLRRRGRRGGHGRRRRRRRGPPRRAGLQRLRRAVAEAARRLLEAGDADVGRRQRRRPARGLRVVPRRGAAHDRDRAETRRRDTAHRPRELLRRQELHVQRRLRSGQGRRRPPRGKQIFHPTSMCAHATVSMRALRLRFENSTRALDSSKNQPNRRAREV